MEKIKLFSGYINATQEKVNIIVFTTPVHDSSWNAVAFQINSFNKTITIVGEASNSGANGFVNDVRVKSLLTQKLNGTFSSSSKGYTLVEDIKVQTKDITIDCILDDLLKSLSISRLSMTDKDMSGETIESFLQSNFAVKDIIEIAEKAKPWRLNKISRDYAKTWGWFNANHPELVEGLRAKPYIDTFVSNMRREEFAKISKFIFTDYGKNSGVHSMYLAGPPAGGKTTMVNDICFAYNIPLISIVFSKLTSLKSVLKEWDNNPETGNLSPVESCLLLCLKNNLPVVIKIEEANNASVELLTQLSNAISDGLVSCGTTNLNAEPNNFVWFFLYNPNDYGKNSLYDCVKLYDRSLKRNVESIPDASKIANRVDAMVANQLLLCNDKASYIDQDIANVEADISDLIAADTARQDYYSSLLEPCRKFVNRGGNYETVKAFLSAVSSFGSSDTEADEESFIGKYNTGLSYQEIQEQIPVQTKIQEKLVDLVGKINNELFVKLKGKYPHTSDINFAPYVSDRQVAALYDEIVCFDNATKGIESFIRDIIPNDFSMNGSVKGVSVDIFPYKTAHEIVEYLQGDIQELQEIMFEVLKPEKVEEQKKIFLEAAVSLPANGTATTGSTAQAQSGGPATKARNIFSMGGFKF